MSTTLNPHQKLHPSATKVKQEITYLSHNLGFPQHVLSLQIGTHCVFAVISVPPPPIYICSSTNSPQKLTSTHVNAIHQPFDGVQLTALYHFMSTHPHKSRETFVTLNHFCITPPPCVKKKPLSLLFLSPSRACAPLPFVLMGAGAKAMIVILSLLLLLLIFHQSTATTREMTTVTKKKKLEVGAAAPLVFVMLPRGPVPPSGPIGGINSGKNQEEEKEEGRRCCTSLPSKHMNWIRSCIHTHSIQECIVSMIEDKSSSDVDGV